MSLGVTALVRELENQSRDRNLDPFETNEYIISFLVKFCDAQYELDAKFAAAVDMRIRSIRVLRERRLVKHG